jgi:hypothetical protein
MVGDIPRSFYGFDDCGNVCGEENERQNFSLIAEKCKDNVKFFSVQITKELINFFFRTQTKKTKNFYSLISAELGGNLNA